MRTDEESYSGRITTCSLDAIRQPAIPSSRSFWTARAARFGPACHLAVWTRVGYDPASNRYFLPARHYVSSGIAAESGFSPQMAVIDGASRQLLFKIPVGTGAHSVAIDSTRGQVYVPFGAARPTFPTAASRCSRPASQFRSRASTNDSSGATNRRMRVESTRIRRDNQRLRIIQCVQARSTSA